MVEMHYLNVYEGELLSSSEEEILSSQFLLLVPNNTPC